MNIYWCWESGFSCGKSKKYVWETEGEEEPCIDIGFKLEVAVLTLDLGEKIYIHTYIDTLYNFYKNIC